MYSTIDLQLFIHSADLASLKRLEQQLNTRLFVRSTRNSPLVSQILAPSRRAAVAAPLYLAKHGRPSLPKDLASHNCLLYYLQHGLFNNWHFYSGKSPGKTAVDVKVRGDRMTDDDAIARGWAVAGIGIAYKSWLDVRQDVADGRPEIILKQFAGEETPLSMVYPHRSSMSPSLRALLAFQRAQFAALTAP